METPIYLRNKWEDQRVKKKNRKRSLDHATRKFRKLHGRHSNSIGSGLYGYWGNGRQGRMTSMKYDKEMCHDMEGYHNISECLDDSLMANQHNVIPVWVCSCCTYRNIERKSLCQMCFSSYSSHVSSVIEDNEDTTISTTITLGQFCKDILDELDVPVWTCGLCTYCNVGQLPQCQMCNNSYYSANNETISPKDENSDESYPEYVDNDNEKQFYGVDNEATYFSDDMEQNVIDEDNTNITDKFNVQQIYASVTMKLTENKLYQKTKKMKLSKKNEDVLRYTLLECQLNISANDELMQSYSCIPSRYSTSIDSVIIPIKYKYRNQFGEFVGYPNNFPLQTVGEFIWKSQYPSLHKIESQQWNVRYPDNKDIRSPAEKHDIFDVLLQFIPLQDIINSILFPYLGYDDVSVVRIWTTFHENSKHFLTYPMTKNALKSFELYNTPYSTIKNRKIDSDLKLIEIGYSNEYKKQRKKTEYNGYYGYRSRHGKRQLPYYMELKLAKFGRQPHPNDHRRKLRQKRRQFSGPSTAPIRRWYDGSRYRTRRKSGFELKGKKNRRKARARVESSVSKQVYLYKKCPTKVRCNRMNDILNKRYSEKHKRYVRRKWSAYWKLVVE